MRLPCRRSSGAAYGQPRVVLRDRLETRCAPLVTPPETGRGSRAARPGGAVALVFAALVFAAGIIVGRHTAPQTQASADAPAATVAASPAAGKVVFASAGCGACHTLAAAGASGKVGPNLDDAKPDAAHVVDVVTHGKGGMPPYKGRLTDEQIRDVAAYVAQASGG